MSSSVVRIPPYHYIHVLDQNSNVSRLETGPQVFVRKDNEEIITNVMKYITIPPRHYCTIRNPVVKNGVCLALFRSEQIKKAITGKPDSENMRAVSPVFSGCPVSVEPENRVPVLGSDLGYPGIFPYGSG